MTGSYPVRVSMLYNETRDPLPHASVLWPGIPNGHDMGVKAKPFNVPPPMVKNETVIEDLEPDDFGYLTKRFTEYTIDFIERNREAPFFIYLPHNMGRRGQDDCHERP